MNGSENMYLERFVPLTFQRRGGQHVAVTQAPKHDVTLITALGRALWWQSVAHRVRPLPFRHRTGHRRRQDRSNSARRDQAELAGARPDRGDSRRLPTAAADTALVSAQLASGGVARAAETVRTIPGGRHR